MKSNERFALVGYAVTTELMRRRDTGKAASAARLEQAISALIKAGSGSGFRKFIAEEVECKALSQELDEPQRIDGN